MFIPSSLLLRTLVIITPHQHSPWDEIDHTATHLLLSFVFTKNSHARFTFTHFATKRDLILGIEITFEYQEFCTTILIHCFTCFRTLKTTPDLHALPSPTKMLSVHILVKRSYTQPHIHHLWVKLKISLYLASSKFVLNLNSWSYINNYVHFVHITSHTSTQKKTKNSLHLQCPTFIFNHFIFIPLP